MRIEILASGSAGNCYIVSDGETVLMIECGISFKAIKAKTNYFSTMPDGCLISHSHKDHCQAVEDIAKIGIPIYASSATQAEMSIGYYPRLHTMIDRQRFTIKTFEVVPLKMNHDVYCLGFLIRSTVTGEKLFFATDTYYIDYIIPSCDYIMIEANYDVDIMNRRIIAGAHDLVAKERLVRSHMEIKSTLQWLQSNDLSKTRRIYLLHLSDGSSNAEEFKQKVMESTGVPCEIAG